MIAVFSGFGLSDVSESQRGGSLVTVTVVESVSYPPSGSVAFTLTGKTPSWPTSVKVGFCPVASSYCPSLSKSHA